MNHLHKQYLSEYNYYLAMSPKDFRPTYKDWLKWRTRRAVKQFK